jgi:hypothetical protein
MSGFTFVKHQELLIEKIETSKDLIEQPDLAKDENMYIPPLGSSIVISGKSGCGKSTLLANLLLDGRFYGPSEAKPKGWFEKIFLFSPTANGDDVQKSLNIPKKYVFTDLSEAPAMLDVILNSQQEKLDNAEGADKVAQFAIIFDDVIGDTGFMNEKSFTKCFYQVRHVNCTTFICTQHFRKVPKICRLQASFVFFFQGSLAEVEMITEEYAPPMYSKKEFASMVNEASGKRYTFLTINNKVGWEKRFRRNLDDFIVLDRIEHEEDVGVGKDKEDESLSDVSDSDEKKEGGAVRYEKKKSTVCKVEGKKCELNIKKDSGEDQADEWLKTSKKFVSRQSRWLR